MHSHSLSLRSLPRDSARETTWVWQAGSCLLALAAALISRQGGPMYVFALLFVCSEIVAAWLPGARIDTRRARRIQALALFATMAAMLFSSLLFYANLGTTLGGNDEAKIRLWALDSAADLRAGQGLWVVGDWQGHAIPLIVLQAVTTPSFPVTADSHSFAVVEKIYTVFWASWIPVVMYFALRRRFDVDLSYKAAIAIALFPAMLYYGSLCVRDALVTFNYAYFFYLMSSRRKSTWNITLRIILLLYTYAIRHESGAFLGVAWIGYESYMACYYALRNRSAWVAPFLTAIVVCVLAVMAISVDGLVSHLGSLHEDYEELNAEYSSSGSLGMRVRALPQPASEMVFAAIGVGGLIPPQTQWTSPFIELGAVHEELLWTPPRWSWSPGRLLRAASPLAWQLCLPFMWIGYLRRHQLFRGYPEFLAVVTVSMAYMCVIPQYTIDVGKLSAGYPFPLALAFVAYQTSTPTVRRRTFLVFACSVIALAGLYLYMKSN